ncbi:MAG: hypothetical protein GQ565_13335 [Candidatus Aegiribacteria sp.]|nr:hypothetical protein [Candidatus Aegiribacteria sp.]
MLGIDREQAENDACAMEHFLSESSMKRLAAFFEFLAACPELQIFIDTGMNSWKHSGFNVYCAQPIEVCDAHARKILSEYISRAPFSLERMSFNENSRGSSIFQCIFAGNDV